MTLTQVGLLLVIGLHRLDNSRRQRHRSQGGDGQRHLLVDCGILFLGANVLIGRVQVADSPPGVEVGRIVGDGGGVGVACEAFP